MKRITTFLLGLSLIAPSNASVDKEVHKLCIDSKDYLGCVKANQKFQENKNFISKIAYYKFKEPKVESFDFLSERCFDSVGHFSEKFKNHKTKTCYLKPEAIENYLYGRPIDERRVHGQFRITNIINPKSGKIEFRDYEQEAINCSKKISEISLFNSLTEVKNGPWIETGKALKRNLKVCPKNPGHFVLLDGVEANFEKMTMENNLLLVPVDNRSNDQIWEISCNEKKFKIPDEESPIFINTNEKTVLTNFFHNACSF